METEQKQKQEKEQNNQNLAENMIQILVTKLYERHSGQLSLTKAFKYVDTDASSTIDIDEFKTVMKLFGFEPSEHQLKITFKMFGATKLKGHDNDEISYKNFIKIMQKYQNKHPLG